MLLEDSFYSIVAPSEGLYKEKGSKFLSYAYPIESDEEVKGIVTGLKDKYFDARHHCYAWQLGKAGTHFRVNDDGEPSGTAGKPIYGQIKSHELTNILIVVVRYFGGTKLGTSGLINAYRTAASEAINNAEIVEKTINVSYDVRFPYGSMNDVMRVVKEEEPDIISQKFDLSCSVVLSVRKSKSKLLVDRLEKIDQLSLLQL